MPVFNGEAFIERAVASLQSQTETSWELIICDNASTDGTWRIIQREAVKDSRIKVFRNSYNIGMAANLNRTLECASGKWIGFLPADDAYMPPLLETVRRATADPSLKLWTHAHRAKRFHEEGSVVRAYATDQTFNLAEMAETFYLKGNRFGELSCYLSDRAAAKKVQGGFDKDCHTLDLRFWLRLALANQDGRGYFSTEVLTETLLHSASDSANHEHLGTNWIELFTFLNEMSVYPWNRSVRLRQALRATYCLARYGAKLPRGEFTRAARSVAKVIAAVFMRTRSAEWQSNKGE